MGTQLHRSPFVPYLNFVGGSPSLEAPKRASRGRVWIHPPALLDKRAFLLQLSMSLLRPGSSTSPDTFVCVVSPSFLPCRIRGLCYGPLGFILWLPPAHSTSYFHAAPISFLFFPPSRLLGPVCTDSILPVRCRCLSVYYAVPLVDF